MGREGWVGSDQLTHSATLRAEGRGLTVDTKMNDDFALLLLDMGIVIGRIGIRIACPIDLSQMDSLTSEIVSNLQVTS